MNFDEALLYLENSKYGHSKDFSIFKRVLALFDIKETDFNIIQIAGTNGKGTVGTFLSSFIASTNKNVGHFISPHLEDYRERFKVNNELIKERFFLETIEYIKDNLPQNYKDELTYFEISFLTALIVFKQLKLEYIILETGIGGRDDVTNIFESNKLAVITTIGYDHVDILGKTLEEIAKHKAGVIKPSSKVVSFEHSKNVDEIITKRALDINSSIKFLNSKKIEVVDVNLQGSKFKYEDNIFKTSMVGEHQIYNILLAFEAFKSLNLDYEIEKISNIIENLIFEGRMEKIYDKPKVYIDGAHNSEGINKLTYNLNKIDLKNYILVIGSMNDKNIIDDLKELVKSAKHIILTKIDYERAIEPKKMADLLNLKNNDYSIINRVKEVPNYLLDNFSEKDTVIITGSLYLVGEFKTLFKEIQ